MPVVSQHDDSCTSQLSMTVMVGGSLSSGRSLDRQRTVHMEAVHGMHADTRRLGHQLDIVCSTRKLRRLQAMDHGLAVVATCIHRQKSHSIHRPPRHTRRGTGSVSLAR